MCIRDSVDGAQRTFAGARGDCDRGWRCAWRIRRRQGCDRCYRGAVARRRQREPAAHKCRTDGRASGSACMKEIRLTHTDGAGQAHMVNVSSKPDTRREATASGSIRMTQSAFEAIRDNAIAKGDVLGVARIAGMMAAKRTSELIPLCHPIALSLVDIALTLAESLPGVRDGRSDAANPWKRF